MGCNKNISDKHKYETISCFLSYTLCDICLHGNNDEKSVHIHILMTDSWHYMAHILINE